ncbi:DUF4194 domain-containing protein [Bifidobacterium pullorum subsp. saeculare]|uniref:DUF4194 domain-containing protein n=1 Tax=Bifidobacterium pullorum subsp. saeculare TaxID=78257 RepID=A0A938WYN9_9BIFI|nr:DUF4194 domain-containing protein [Bifidobacterium pullorum]MBM6699458.1 DUF4194 domain-containing protein [Bifidobacterium pullorum subsp. saeculare]
MDSTNPFAMFEGDIGDMPADARMAAIALKRGRYITGAMYDIAADNREAVERSLNNDLLRLTDNPRYRVMVATPVGEDEVPIRSLKTRVGLRPQDAALLALLRIRVLEYENTRVAPGDWVIGVDEVRAQLTGGAGFLAASNDEEGVQRQIDAMLRSATTNGYLEEDEEDGEGMYRITPLVPAVLDQTLAGQWLDEAGLLLAQDTDQDAADQDATAGEEESDR